MSDGSLNKWDCRFLKIAKEISTWSKDPSTKVGAVLVLENRILTTGYNGFPSGIADTIERLQNRPLKYEYTIHAEMNALLQALRYGVSANGATLYVYGLPCCANCTKHIIQSGVERVVFAYEAEREKWIVEYDQTSSVLFKESGVTVTIIGDFI